jgi:hydrogenase maturation factor
MGKLTNKELKKLLSCVRRGPQVIVPPLPGYDSGAHRLGNETVVVSTDPCTGVPEAWFGWLLINYAASDVALFGAKPEFCTVNLLGPLKTKTTVFEKAMQQACTAADELGMEIVAGHTATYESLSQLLGVCTAYGTVKPEKLLTPGNSKAGDCILCTKPVGLETAVNFSLTQKAQAQKLFGQKRAEELASLVHMQGCVKDALQLAAVDGVHAMHDATEGGLVAALNEMAEASNLGFTIEFERIRITLEMAALRDAFELSDEQMLAMSSTGTILAAVSPVAKDNVEKVVQKSGLTASFIGNFTYDGNRVLSKKGRDTPFPNVAEDPYARILSGKV